VKCLKYASGEKDRHTHYNTFHLSREKQLQANFVTALISVYYSDIEISVADFWCTKIPQ